MAIKFVDVEPEGAPKPKRSGKVEAPPMGREPDAGSSQQPAAPELPHPKPEPKPRGRKKPLR